MAFLACSLFMFCLVLLQIFINLSFALRSVQVKLGSPPVDLHGIAVLGIPSWPFHGESHFLIAPRSVSFLYVNSFSLPGCFFAAVFLFFHEVKELSCIKAVG